MALEDPDHRLARLAGVRDRVTLHAASIESYASIHQVVAKVVPDECYHLAAQSFVSYSFDDEFSTLNANINGTQTYYEPRTVAYDMWLDEDALMRRVEFDMAQQISMVMEMSEWGEPVRIEAPSPRQIVEAPGQ